MVLPLTSEDLWVMWTLTRFQGPTPHLEYGEQAPNHDLLHPFLIQAPLAVKAAGGCWVGIGEQACKSLS